MDISKEQYDEMSQLAKKIEPTLVELNRLQSEIDKLKKHISNDSNRLKALMIHFNISSFHNSEVTLMKMYGNKFVGVNRKSKDVI